MGAFNNILIANRGEIAVRIMRTARALGYRTIAVYSEADIGAPHVRLADDAALIGPPPVELSYLNPGRILEAARKTGAEAIHPGYGFLSENGDFARACDDEGLIFIGPPADVIELMGNKAAAKRQMRKAGVPCVTGYEGADQSDLALGAAADDIGFPIMVKAAAGGGGRGMRLVGQADLLANALKEARLESKNAFGSDELILEKAIVAPRHVEFQILADKQGNVVHIGERDCSIQRRHQKVIEEAPSPAVDEKLRSRMGMAAVEAARCIGYRGAGTVEFLLDSEGDFYFMEMNTRLQVEHPITEMISGLDLVALQIKIANGQPLGLTQGQIDLRGHAIEARLYAEDPANGFIPCSGKVDLWRSPQGEGVRFDCGIETGQEISPFYDPMIAKAVAWGETREVARRRLINALKETLLFGVTANRKFLIDILEKDTFVRGEATTDFIGKEFSEASLADCPSSEEQAAIASAIHYEVERQYALEKSICVSAELMNWSSGGRLATRYVYSSGRKEFDLTVCPENRNSYRVKIDGRAFAITLRDLTDDTASLQVDGRHQRAHYLISNQGLICLSLDGRTFKFANRLALSAIEEKARGGNVMAPMHGVLREIAVTQGDNVSPGARLAVLEAMKMQHSILSEVGGTVREVLGEVGQQVAAGDLLMEIDTNQGS